MPVWNPRTGVDIIRRPIRCGRFPGHTVSLIIGVSRMSQSVSVTAPVLSAATPVKHPKAAVGPTPVFAD